MIKKNEFRLDCSCNAIDHSMQFVIDDDPGFRMLYINIFLGNKTFFKRVVAAVKYIFGYKCKYGHFDERLVSVEEAKNLRKFLNGYIGK